MIIENNDCNYHHFSYSYLYNYNGQIIKSVEFEYFNGKDYIRYNLPAFYDSKRSISVDSPKTKLDLNAKDVDREIDITCYLPNGKDKDQIKVHFDISSGYFNDTFSVGGDISLIDGSTDTIHLNDYVTIHYYDADGVIDGIYSYFEDINADFELGFMFDSDFNRENGEITCNLDTTTLQCKPPGAFLTYYDGSQYQNVLIRHHSE